MHFKGLCLIPLLPLVYSNFHFKSVAPKVFAQRSPDIETENVLQLTPVTGSGSPSLLNAIKRSDPVNGTSSTAPLYGVGGGAVFETPISINGQEFKVIVVGLHTSRKINYSLAGRIPAAVTHGLQDPISRALISRLGPLRLKQLVLLDHCTHHPQHSRRSLTNTLQVSRCFP